MSILAIETATDACSVALSVNGMTTERYACVPREHAPRVLGMVDELLVEAGIVPTDIDAIAFGRGPGSFLGTRIAASIAQSLALCWDCRLLPVSTLAGLATQHNQKTGAQRVLSAWDARIQSIYWGDYQCVDGLMIAKEGDRLWSPDQFEASLLEGDVALVGNAWKTYGEKLPVEFTQLIEQQALMYPRASGLLPLAECCEPVTLGAAVPIYLRHPVTSN